jgi:hypothetical protein
MPFAIGWTSCYYNIYFPLLREGKKRKKEHSSIYFLRTLISYAGKYDSHTHTHTQTYIYN